MFGTDGIRGVVGSEWVNAHMFQRLGWVLARCHTLVGQQPRILIGRDPRSSSGELSAALQQGLQWGGAEVCDAGMVSTPVVSFLTARGDYQLGLMVTASHNPHTDNGVKIFQGNGAKLTVAQQENVQESFNRSMAQTPTASALCGRETVLQNSAQPYIDSLVQHFSKLLAKYTGKIVVDCANGATSQLAPIVIQRLGLTATMIHHQPDGRNINQQCGSTDLASLVSAVHTHQADIGVAFDGDGDRLLIVDGRGQVIDGDDMLYAMVRYHQSINDAVPGVVGTLMSNEGLVQALATLSVEFCRAPVGDRHVVAQLLQRGWRFGAEPSGHVIDMAAAKTGDGLMTFLHCLTCLQGMQWSPKQLVGAFERFPQKLINVPVVPGFDIRQASELQAVQQRITQELGHSGRCLLRASGTEPVVRVMVECQDQQLLQQSIDHLCSAVVAAVARFETANNQ
jgi:phosphoglucosamine mutase